MPRQDSDILVSMSLLDRLVDLEPRTPGDAPMTRAQSVRQLKTSLRHDLEWLLNTRRTPDPAPESFVELNRSLFHYGLPDITNVNIRSPKDQHRLTWMLESAVSVFEPRLEGVTVRMEQVSPGQRMIRFQIEGMLRMDPAPERVSFDTVLELSTGNYQVKGEAGGAR
jgi:type VI secretion system protein ImpF